MNVLFVSETRLTHTPYKDGSIRYRCYHMAEALQAAGHIADVTALDNIEFVNLSRYDVVSVHRPSASTKLLKVLERCEKLGIRTVADLDSLEFDPSLAAESPKKALKNRSVNSVRAEFMRQQLALQHFDEACVATEELARARRSQAPWQPVYVAGNGLSNFWLSCNDKINITPPANKRITYISGVKGAETDFSEAADAINQFLTSTPDSELNIIGPLNLDNYSIDSSKVVRGTWTDFMNMPAVLANSWVTVSPKHSTPISYARPHTHFIESAAFGVPTICTPTADLERHEVQGLHLAENTEQWLQAFDALSDKEYYASCQESLKNYARNNCLASQQAQVLIERWSASNEESKDENLTTLSAAS